MSPFVPQQQAPLPQEPNQVSKNSQKPALVGLFILFVLITVLLAGIVIWQGKQIADLKTTVSRLQTDKSLSDNQIKSLQDRNANLQDTVTQLQDEKKHAEQQINSLQSGNANTSRIVNQESDLFAQANDTKRRSDVNAILNALDQYAADNKGNFPRAFSEIPQPISKSAADICSSIVTTYLAGLPVDPTFNNGTVITDCNTNYNTGYTVAEDQSGRVTISAPHASSGNVIQVTR